jgi:hypothetical protein
MGDAAAAGGARAFGRGVRVGRARLSVKPPASPFFVRNSIVQSAAL